MDKLKYFMVHSCITVQPASVGPLLALSKIFGFTVWSGDVRREYVQSVLPLNRDVYTGQVMPKFELEPHPCLKLLRKLYGICDSGDQWNATIENHHRKTLEMVEI